jgi:hypothetical protein
MRIAGFGDFDDFGEARMSENPSQQIRIEQKLVLCRKQ